MDTKYFGSSGIRGQVGKTYINAEFFLKLGWAVGKALATGKNDLILIGKDTRISGYMFESALQAGLSAAGTNVGLTGPIPTPAMAYLTRTFRARGGIIISASHNTYGDNGLKLFSSAGTKLPDQTEFYIESLLSKSLETVSPENLGKAKRFDDAASRYIEFCKSTLPLGTNLDRYKIVLDCANGANYFIAPHVFRELGATVIPINNNPNGTNINQDCGSTHPEALRKAVMKHEADLGIAFDGDGDRVIMVDNSGNIIDGDEILYIIALLKIKQGNKLQAVVGTEMTNTGIEVAFRKLNINLIRAPVGDRHVLELMESHNTILGGESSGHVICLDKTVTGDGIVAALQVLHALLILDKSLHEITVNIDKFPQALINVPIDNPADDSRSITMINEIMNISKEFDKNSRILVRASNTEPLIRVMLEGENRSLINKRIEDLTCLVKNLQPKTNQINSVILN